jgi:hypothetical protein
MNNNNIQEILLREHNRDKKLTYYAFALYAVIGIVVISVLSNVFLSRFSGNESTTSTPIYYKLIIPIILIAFGFSIFKKIKTLNNRHLLIEKLFNDLNAGKKAASITQFVDYKITLPLGKIRVRLYPINFVCFSIQNEVYNLPVPPAIEPDFKVLLSGVNIDHVNNLKENLNSDKVIETIESVPLKTIPEFKEYADTELAPVLKNLEKSRKKGLSFSIIGIVFSVLVVGGFMFFNYTKAADLASNPENASSYTSSIFIVFGILCAIIYLVYIPIMKKRYKQIGDSGENYTSFKEQIFKKMIAFINPSFQYVEHGYIGARELHELDIFRDKNYDVTGNDQILGSYNGVPFQYCDLYMSHTPTFRLQNESPEEVFSGQFFMAKFNKTFSTQIVISPKAGISEFIIGNSFSSNIVKPSAKIMLEDPEFAKMFDVYANDQVEARYILTPTTMQNIKDIAHKAKGSLFFFFINNKIIAANNNRINKFETGVTTKLNPELLVSFYEDLYKQFSIIDDLKLNINIWKQQAN